jgi:hypothetical protein
MKKKPSKTRHREPSKASLREIPEVDFSKTRTRRNRYAKRIAAEGIVVQVGRGRPKRIVEVGGTASGASSAPTVPSGRPRTGGRGGRPPSWATGSRRSGASPDQDAFTGSSVSSDRHVA